MKALVKVFLVAAAAVAWAEETPPAAPPAVKPAPAPAAKAPPPAEWTNWLRGSLTDNDVTLALEGAWKAFNAEAPVPPMLRVYAQRLRVMATYPFLELDSARDRRWLGGLMVLAEKMAENRQTFSALVDRKGSPEYNQLVAEYDALKAAFRKSQLAPVVVTDRSKLKTLATAKAEALERLQRNEAAKAAKAPAAPVAPAAPQKKTEEKPTKPVRPAKTK